MNLATHMTHAHPRGCLRLRLQHEQPIKASSNERHAKTKPNHRMPNIHHTCITTHTKTNMKTKSRLHLCHQTHITTPKDRSPKEQGHGQWAPLDCCPSCHISLDSLADEKATACGDETGSCRGYTLLIQKKNS